MGTAWGAIAAGLQRGLTGGTRMSALIAHALTPFGALLACTILSFGFLHAEIALTAEWWALALVTRFRPERLVAPETSNLPRLAAWLATTIILAFVITAMIF